MGLWDRLQRRLGDLAGELVLDDYRDQLDAAQQLIAAGDVTAAIETLEALLAAKPNHGQALIVLGDARLATRDLPRAREAFERALQERANDPAAMLGMGMTLLTDGKYDGAITWLGRAVGEAGGDRAILADLYRGLGTAWRRRGDLDKAVRELRKSVVEDADDRDARAALGEALVADGGPYDEALRHLERAATAEPVPSVALLGLGRLALHDGSPANARTHLAHARTLADLDTTPLGLAVRLDILLAEGDAALADRDAMRAHGLFLEALQLEPRRVDIHARIAAAHRSIGNLDAALQSFDRALALGASLDVLRTAVDTAIQAGDVTREMQWGDDLLAADPDNPRALVARGAAMARVPESAAAARALLEIAAGRDDVDAHVALARLHLATDPARAAAAALAALRVVPHHQRAREVLAEARAAELGVPGNEIAEVAQFLETTVAARRELGHLVGEIARAAANLDQPLLVTVMGEFSSGKSSFVNAFIGADVAPTGITPTTATINVVRYGRERGGRIVARDGAALELTWEELMRHLRALTPDAARAIDRVEILVPLPQLERINIVDTPGLNSIQAEHEATARAFIARADAIVWVFTASQGGKASEKKALRSIREEGKRVLGVLNKADTLSPEETTEVTTFVSSELGELVEAIVPFSARRAAAWKAAGSTGAITGALGGRTDGNWGTLHAALEERFFTQARQLKRDACARALRGTTAAAMRIVTARQDRAGVARAAAYAARDELLVAAREFDGAVLVERKALSELTTALYRRASREVMELVRPRRLPFSSHTATAADRDYLIALLAAGFDTAIEAGRRRVADELMARCRHVTPAARTLSEVLAVDVVEDLQRTADDRIGLAMSRVFERTRAYLHGYLAGGYVESFFRNDVPKLELAEDAVYHALMRNAPDLDRELGEPLAHAATDTLTAVARRLEHWGAVVDVQTFDLEVGIGRALEHVSARLG
ncbi:MAG: dynamin family protein [Proteobacteria bacterium]|nr:dynamin family protein [Pseudomonadota bacterium]